MEIRCSCPTMLVFFTALCVKNCRHFREKYKKTIAEFYDKGPKTENNQILMPKTQILYCRKMEDTFDKSEFENINYEFNDLHHQLRGVLNFENKILSSEYKGLISDPKEIFINSYSMYSKLWKEESENMSDASYTTFQGNTTRPNASHRATSVSSITPVTVPKNASYNHENFD